MRMGRVLALVAGALVLCIAGLGLAVYFTRDEDNLQADNLLAENFTKAVTLAPQNDGKVELPALARFEWDRVLLVQPGTSRAAISQRLGHEWTGIDTVDGGDLLLFVKDGKVVRFADYRGSNTFEGFERPFDEIAREDATFAVRDRVVRPTG
ncbi:hypothetical protein OM076_35145 [Solirubrobacter ginsenosidimutans]|uniref:Uncharacterized protein n=1 Tax=Solirubrobacter ginsenosidimutans TaxID=490573 RepID=A0A9X3MZD2_9ACTN|nr:hypothetical protein [Solirubrobacter ginsenosidimutans]MDA0165559.1 hypothetical protein [Solirubrobacter ginsenosidimutans]